MSTSRVHIDQFVFHNMFGIRGWCEIEVIDGTRDRAVVIAIERQGNPGMSITNAAEYVATEVCRHLAIDPHRLVWIEHYG